MPTATQGRCTRSSCRTKVGRRAADLRRHIGTQIVTLRLDVHLSQRRLADAADIDQGHLSRIERGLSEPSLSVLVALGDALGADLTVRLYPSTGPRIRDHLQAHMTEALLARVDPSWRQLLEVAVTRPARGFIDLVLARPTDPVLAVELHSELRRLEQQVRWASDKAGSLPSAPEWSFLSEGRPDVGISRLLILRSTRATRDLANSFAQTLAAVYPARTEDAVAALVRPDVAWPGAAVVWAEVRGSSCRILETPPRSVRLGR